MVAMISLGVLWLLLGVGITYKDLDDKGEGAFKPTFVETLMKFVGCATIAVCSWLIAGVYYLGWQLHSALHFMATRKANSA